ncbi:putative RTA1 domain protein [Xylogone sp. PMI_703]|nr:putative RTA1 domain protein [Xylogone sp. PMI_703]
MPAPAVDSIYPYKPNKIAIIAAAILFGIGAVVHVYQMIRFRAWYYLALVTGAIMMTAGYAFRYLSALHPAALTPYILQTLGILLPPSLYAATIYMIYGRIVVALFPSDANSPLRTRASLVPARRVTTIFVVGDVVSFLLQVGGGGMTGIDGKEKLGESILLVGLAVQLVFFGTFFALAVVFERRAGKMLRNLGGQDGAELLEYQSLESRNTTTKVFRWRPLLFLLFTAAALIIARCVYRIIEYAQGHNGYLVKKEVFLYIFDALPMLFVQYLFHFLHAGKILPAA